MLAISSTKTAKVDAVSLTTILLTAIPVSSRRSDTLGFNSVMDASGASAMPAIDTSVNVDTVVVALPIAPAVWPE